MMPAIDENGEAALSPSPSLTGDDPEPGQRHPI